MRHNYSPHSISLSKDEFAIWPLVSVSRAGLLQGGDGGKGLEN